MTLKDIEKLRRSGKRPISILITLEPKLQRFTDCVPIYPGDSLSPLEGVMVEVAGYKAQGKQIRRVCDVLEAMGLWFIDVWLIDTDEMWNVVDFGCKTNKRRVVKGKNEEIAEYFTGEDYAHRTG